jgi:uncharacterized protein (TIRG00374 family)
MTASDSSKQTTLRTRLINIAKIGLTVVAVGYLVYVAKPDQILAYLRVMDKRLLIGILVLKFITDIFKIWKWLILARVEEADFSYWKAFKSFYMGIALAVITPFAIGELGRGALISQEHKAELSGLVMLDKVFDLATVALFSFSGLLVLNGKSGLIVLLIAAYLTGMILIQHLVRLVEKLDFIGIFKLKIVNRLAASIRQVSVRIVLQSALLSVVYFSLFYLQAYLIMLSYGESFPLDVVLYFPLITLSTIIPITIGGVGIREGTAILLLRQYGVSEALAFNTFFMHFVIANVVAGLLGAVLFLLPQKNSSPAKTITESK